MRKTFLLTAQAFIVLVAFVTGLFAGTGDSSPPTVAEGIISVPLVILFMPLVTVLLFRLEVAIGIFRPPWDTPSCAAQMNPLSAVRLGSWAFTAAGAGATLAIVWRGIAAVPYALIGLAGGFALHLALMRLVKRYSQP